jgi:hypothetical protein
MFCFDFSEIIDDIAFTNHKCVRLDCRNFKLTSEINVTNKRFLTNF